MLQALFSHLWSWWKMWIFGFSLGVCPTELRNLVSSLEYLVSNGRRVLLGDIRLGGSATIWYSLFVLICLLGSVCVKSTILRFLWFCYNVVLLELSVFQLTWLCECLSLWVYISQSFNRVVLCMCFSSSNLLL